ncbi:hypothetical protein HK101_000471 [Irineochytrium annulatum]|nr:hypothetical protein HK101_000471 [Irineochytrium annulatum]
MSCRPMFAARTKLTPSSACPQPSWSIQSHTVPDVTLGDLSRPVQIAAITIEDLMLKFLVLVREVAEHVEIVYTNDSWRSGPRRSTSCKLKEVLIEGGLAAYVVAVPMGALQHGSDGKVQIMVDFSAMAVLGGERIYDNRVGKNHQARICVNDAVVFQESLDLDCMKCRKRRPGRIRRAAKKNIRKGSRAEEAAKSPADINENEEKIPSTTANSHWNVDGDGEKTYSAKNTSFSSDSIEQTVFFDNKLPPADVAGPDMIKTTLEDAIQHAKDEGDRTEELLDDDELCDRRRRHHRSPPACWEDDFDVCEEDGDLDGNEGSAAVGATDARLSAEARESTTATSPGVPHYGTDLEWAQVEVEDHEGVWIAEVVEVGILIVRPLSDEVLEPEEHAALPPQSCHLLQVPSIDYSVGRMYLDDEVRFGCSGTPPGQRGYLFQSVCDVMNLQIFYFMPRR